MATTLLSIISQVRTHLMELATLTTPLTPAIVPQGTAGASTWSYQVEALNRDNTSAASSAGTTTTGNATLSSTNFNRITWTAVTGATAYRIYRTAVATSPITTGVIAIVGNVTQLDDTGLVGNGAAAPSAATGGTFWNDIELLDIIANGGKDLWAAYIDVFQDHFFIDDITNVTLVAGTNQLAGVPANTFRVLMIEPRDTTSAGPHRGLVFIPKKYNHPEFIAARAYGTMEPSNYGVIFYDVTGVGSPVGTPVIVTAPKLSATVNLRFVYNPVLATLTLASNNPIPGESDQALIAYGVAFARAKEREDRSPDPNWIAVYATEKQSLLTRITPRQEQEAEEVMGMFEGIYY